jgi:outer membrane protein assembly factor BamB
MKRCVSVVGLLCAVLISPAGGQQDKPTEGRQPGTLRWTFSVDKESVSSASVGADGTVYVCGKGRLYALSGEGKKKWDAGLDTDTCNAPSIGTDGTVYVASHSGHLHAISQSGQKKWSFEHELSKSRNPADMVRSMLQTPAIRKDGMLCIGSSAGWVDVLDSQGKGLLRLQPATFFSHALVLNGTDDAFCPVVSGYRLLDKEGKEKWSYKTDSSARGLAAIGSDGTFYVSEYSETGLLAIGPDGTKKWKLIIEGELGSPCVGSDGTVYVGIAMGNKAGALMAVNSDGTEKWRVRTDSAVVSPPAIGEDGVVYFGCRNKTLWAVGADRSKKWEFAADGELRSSPVIAKDGTVYVTSRAGTLYAIASTSKGLADSAWPMEQHDPQRTSRAGADSRLLWDPAKEEVADSLFLTSRNKGLIETLVEKLGKEAAEKACKGYSASGGEAMWHFGNFTWTPAQDPLKETVRVVVPGMWLCSISVRTQQKVLWSHQVKGTMTDVVSPLLPVLRKGGGPVALSIEVVTEGPVVFGSPTGGVRDLILLRPKTPPKAGSQGGK